VLTALNPFHPLFVRLCSHQAPNEPIIKEGEELGTGEEMPVVGDERLPLLLDAQQQQTSAGPHKPPEVRQLHASTSMPPALLTKSTAQAGEHSNVP